MHCHPAGGFRQSNVAVQQVHVRAAGATLQHEHVPQSATLPPHEYPAQEHAAGMLLCAESSAALTKSVTPPVSNSFFIGSSLARVCGSGSQ